MRESEEGGGIGDQERSASLIEDAETSVEEMLEKEKSVWIELKKSENFGSANFQTISLELTLLSMLWNLAENTSNDLRRAK